jgi:16S rRNA (cytidine1402-2'-O)-methyltransferase
MLYLVPTPIGNLDDITLRALDTLKTADYVLAEDTRTTGKLFKHHNIQQKFRAFHAHNEHKATSAIIDDLSAGMNIALVSDAGTPGLSDPGFLLVRACHEAEIQVTCLPGATALIPAVILSGFPSDRFSFEGFLPHKKGRQTRWEQLSQLDSTFVCYESPHRLLKFLREAEANLAADQQIAVVREISKIHESVHRGTATELIAFFEANQDKARGEIVIVVSRVD